MFLSNIFEYSSNHPHSREDVLKDIIAWMKLIESMTEYKGREIISQSHSISLDSSGFMSYCGSAILQLGKTEEEKKKEDDSKK